MTMLELLEESPIIAAVKDESGLKCCMESDCKVVFVLFGTICDIGDIIEKIKSCDKIAIVHIDMISGLVAKDVAVEYIRNNTKADGIISTKPHLLKRAKDLGLIAVQRTFVVDSIALTNLKKQLELFKPDAVEILPGIMPRITKIIRGYTRIPLIAGGLILDRKDVIEAIESGADGVSMTKTELWRL